jgi:hypothetical protein
MQNAVYIIAIAPCPNDEESVLAAVRADARGGAASIHTVPED